MWYQVLKKLREEKGLTQQDVANYLQMSRTGYSHYESGHSQPSIDQIIKLSRFYAVTTDYLLNLTTVNLKNEKHMNKQIDETILMLEEMKKGYVKK
ncbi:MAG: helix-turn-helix transcriptional regulator [Acholeplasmataceae bacterium]